MYGPKPARSRHCEWGVPPDPAREPLGRPRAHLGRPGHDADPRVRRPGCDHQRQPLSRQEEWSMREHLVWILALSLAAPAVAAAQEQKSVDPVVITATKVATPSEQIGASISVVNGDDFQTYHYPTVDEALRNVPGVEIRRSGSYGKTSSITIRGSNANQVQVLVDGVRVKSPTLGQVDLSDISPDLIDRIEIIRGPQSTLYGADAIGGVINIITKKGTGPFSGYFSQEAGNYDTYATRSGFSGAWGLFDYALGASHMESNGHFKNDDSDQNALNLRLGVSLPYRSSIGFTLRYN